MSKAIAGIHHITAITADAQANIEGIELPPRLVSLGQR